MQVITNTPAEPHKGEVTVKMTGQEVALIYEALAKTDSRIFSRLAQRFGLDATDVCTTDDELFTSFSTLVTAMGVHQ